MSADIKWTTSSTLRTESCYSCESKDLPYPLQNVVLLGDHEETQPRSRLLNALHHAGVLLAPGRRPVDGDYAVTGAQSRLSRRRIRSYLLHKNRVHGLVDLGPLVSRQHLQGKSGLKERSLGKADFVRPQSPPHSAKNRPPWDFS